MTGGAYSLPRNLTVADAVQRMLTELRALGIREEGAIISTNVEPRLDRLPRSNRTVSDPGVAVYWKKAKETTYKVMAVDRYTAVQDNLAALAATLAAMRAIERHGGAMILERAFTGFDVLPDPHNWRHVLGFQETPTLDAARNRFKALAKTGHPDHGGSEQRMQELNAAWASAQRDLLPVAEEDR